LLDAGKRVRALVRDPSKAAGLKARGAEVVALSLSDREALAQALAGAEGAYLLSPPDVGSADFLTDRRKLLDDIAGALERSQPSHTVFLSSIGAQRESGTGIIASLNYAERTLRSTGQTITFLRAGYFVDNWAAVLPAAVNDGVLPSFLPAGLAIPQVSTTDIGRIAAQLLLESGRGQRSVELAGPEEASAGDVARALSSVLGRPVRVLEAPLAAVVPTFTSFGISANVAGLYRDMYQGIIDGTVAWEGSPALKARGRETLESTLRGLLAPQ
jgi:uncharacterized protein YbjT (DUF2867 family)